MATTIVTTNQIVTQTLNSFDAWMLLEGVTAATTTGPVIETFDATTYDVDLYIAGNIVGANRAVDFSTDSLGGGLGIGSYDIYVAQTGSVVSAGSDTITMYGSGNVLTNYGEITTLFSPNGAISNMGDDLSLRNYGVITGRTGLYLLSPAGEETNAHILNAGQITGDANGIYSQSRLTLNNTGTIIALDDDGGSVGIYSTISNVLTSVGSTINNSGTISGQTYSLRFDGSEDNTVINTGHLIGRVGFGNGDDLFDGRGGTVDGTVFGGAGDDRLIGGDADDVLNGGDGADALYGGAGNDTADYSEAPSGVAANLTTGAGTLGYALDDRFVSIENLSGSMHMDTLIGHGGVNEISGGAGNDTLEGRSGADVLYGDAGNDTLRGENGSDTLLGGAGADMLEGGNDADLLYGGADDDTLIGGEQDDTLSGDAGDDVLYGDNGDDILRGGDDNDTLYGGNNEDEIRGGDGVDVLYGDAQNDTLYGDDGNDTLNGGNGDDNLTGGYGNDILNGGNNVDWLFGETGNDTLNGEGQSDILYGGYGDDTLDGGNGNDTLFGQHDNDTLTGGNDSDDFVFYDDFGVDVITDFNHWDANEDINLVGVTAITDYADLVANHLSTNGAGDAVITDGANSITLTGVTEAQLAADDFMF